MITRTDFFRNGFLGGLASLLSFHRGPTSTVPVAAPRAKAGELTCRITAYTTNEDSSLRERGILWDGPLDNASITVSAGYQGQNDLALYGDWKDAAFDMYFVEIFRKGTCECRRLCSFKSFERTFDPPSGVLVGSMCGPVDGFDYL